MTKNSFSTFKVPSSVCCLREGFWWGRDNRCPCWGTTIMTWRSGTSRSWGPFLSLLDPTYTCPSQKLSFDWCSWRNSHQKPTADVTTAPQSWKKDFRVRKKLTDGQIPHSSYWRCLSKGSSLFHFLFEVAIKPCFVYSQSFNQLFVLHKKET